MGNNEDDNDDDVDNIFENNDEVVSTFMWLAFLWVVSFCDNFLRDVVDNFIFESYFFTLIIFVKLEWFGTIFSYFCFLPLLRFTGSRNTFGSVRRIDLKIKYWIYLTIEYCVILTVFARKLNFCIEFNHNGSIKK